MAVMKPHISFAAWFFPTLLLGLAVGIQAAVITVTCSICTPNGLIATAATTVSATRGFGGSIGVVIFGVIFNSKIKMLPSNIATAAIKAGLSPTSVPGLISAGLSGDAAALMKVPEVDPAIIAAMTVAQANTYADSFRYVWYALIPFAVLALIITLFVRSTKAQMTSQIASTVEHRHHQYLSKTLELQFYISSTSLIKDNGARLDQLFKLGESHHFLRDDRVSRYLQFSWCVWLHRVGGGVMLG